MYRNFGDTALDATTLMSHEDNIQKNFMQQGGGVFLEKLIVSTWSTNSPPFVEPKVSLPSSQ
jgi:hypothetical protein